MVDWEIGSKGDWAYSFLRNGYIPGAGEETSLLMLAEHKP